MDLNHTLARYLRDFGYSIVESDGTGVMLKQCPVSLSDVREDVIDIVNREDEFRGLRVQYFVRQNPDGIFIERL